MSKNIAFANLMADVATDLWGKPNEHQSTSKELRWGTRGARVVDLEKGVWFDHETGEGGGVLDLIMREEHTDKAGALQWLRDHRYIDDTVGSKPGRNKPHKPPVRYEGGEEAAEEEEPKPNGTGRDDSKDDQGDDADAEGLTLARYAEAKRLTLRLLEQEGLSDVYIGKRVVRIPYMDGQGSVTAVRFRLHLKRNPRFNWRKGDKPSLYGLHRLKVKRKDPELEAKLQAMADVKRNTSEPERANAAEMLEKLRAETADSECFLVEGESDTHTLWEHKLEGLGLPGISGWNEQRDAVHLQGIAKIYLCVEPNAAEAISHWLPYSAIREQVLLFDLGDVKDISELHLQCNGDHEQFLKRLTEATAKAEPWSAIERRQKDVKRKEAYAKCAGLADKPDILAELDKAFDALGLVGERNAAKLVYLAITSRRFRKPVSVVIKGPSSGGKSYVVEVTVQLFPPDAFYTRTGMSEKAIVFTDEDLRHRTLVVYEAAGLDNNRSAVFVRTLLSEGHLKYEFPDKTAKGIRGRVIEKEGPTNLILTTTGTLEPELETRMLSLTVTDSSAQTKAIMEKLAKLDGTPAEFDFTDSQAWALQRWIASGPAAVVFEWADRLAQLTEPVAVRLRRDFSVLLSLVRAHALLHQASRDRDDKGRIVATREDYRAVRALIIDALSQAVGKAVPPHIRETVNAVATLLGIDPNKRKEEASETGLFGDKAPPKRRRERRRSDADDDDDGGDDGGKYVTIDALMEVLKLDRSTVWRRVKQAQGAGYLINLEEKPRRPARIVLGQPMPDDAALLPEADELTLTRRRERL